MKTSLLLAVFALMSPMVFAQVTPPAGSAPSPAERIQINDALKKLIEQTDPATKATFDKSKDLFLVATGAAGIDVMYQPGPDSLPQPGVPKGKLIGPYTFHSQVFANTTRQYWVYVPAQYTPDKPAAVLVFQDGQRAIAGVLNVPQVMENLIAKKEMPVTIGIFVTAGAAGDTYRTNGNNPGNRSAEYDAVTDKFSHLIIDEILPEVGKSYNLTKDPDGRAIGGTSSGAIAAFTVAWFRADQFHKVIGFISSFTNINGGGAYPGMVLQADRKPIRMFMADGVNDDPGPQYGNWHQANDAMAAALTEKGYDLKYVVGLGIHSDYHGGAMLGDVLRWLWRDYPGVAPYDANRPGAFNPKIVPGIIPPLASAPPPPGLIAAIPPESP